MGNIFNSTQAVNFFFYSTNILLRPKLSDTALLISTIFTSLQDTTLTHLRCQKYSEWPHNVKCFPLFSDRTIIPEKQNCSDCICKRTHCSRTVGDIFESAGYSNLVFNRVITCYFNLHILLLQIGIRYNAWTVCKKHFNVFLLSLDVVYDVFLLNCLKDQITKCLLRK